MRRMSPSFTKAGAWMTTPDDTCFAPSPDPGPIVSTVGAGDSFTAAAMIGYLNGKSLKTINRRANAIAAYVCTQMGAVPPLPANLISR